MKTDITSETVNDAVREYRRNIQFFMKEKKASLRQIFNSIDKDQDAVLNCDEFVESIKRFCPILDANNERLMEEMFKQFRTVDKIFTVSFDDYKQVILEESKGLRVSIILEQIRKGMIIRGEEDLKNIFESVDIDKSNALSLDEFTVAMKMFDSKLLEEEIKALFMFFDKGGAFFIKFCNNKIFCRSSRVNQLP